MSTILSNLAGTLRTAFRIARATLDVSGLTTARVATLPDKSGTIAMLDDLAGYAPASHVGAGGTAHAAATTSVAGFMSAADKTKLDGVAVGATANTGTVTSVTVSVGTGMSGGGTVTTSGTISIALNANLQSWSGVAPSNYGALSSANTWNASQSINGILAIRQGSSGTQAILQNFGWAGGNTRWNCVIETDADLSFWSYDVNGGNAVPRLRLDNAIGGSVLTVGATSLTYGGETVFHTGNLLDIGTTAASARTALALGSAATSATTDFAPASHVGAGGTAHAAATTTVAGFMSAADKTKLDGVAAGATANAGTVTSVTVSVGTGMTGGGTVSTSGTISIALNANLQSWSAVAPSAYAALASNNIWSAAQNLRIGTANTQVALESIGWSGGNARWQVLLESDADLSFWSYDASGGSANARLRLDNTPGGATLIVGGSTLTYNAQTVWHGGNLLNIGTTAASARTALGLGSAATSNTGDFAAASHTHDASAITSGEFNRLRLGPNALAGRYLICTTTGTNWVDLSVNLEGAVVTGTLPVVRGGTGVTSSTGTGSVVLNNNPYFSSSIFVGTSGGGNAQIEASASEANFLARNGVTMRLGQQFGQTADVHLYNGSGDRLTVKSSGRVGIGTTGPSEQLHVIGNILASGTITPNSDARLKTDITPCRLTLDQIALTAPVEFTRTADGSRGLGVLAQDLEAVLPIAVLTADDEQGTKAVSYGEAAMVMVINLAREVQALRARIEELERE